MNGYGHFLPGQLAFQGYWALFLLTLMCLASALWVRGVSQGLRQRLALAGRRLRGPTGVFAGLAALAFAGVGSWLCWSTNPQRVHLARPAAGPAGPLRARAVEVPQPAAAAHRGGGQPRGPVPGIAVDGDRCELDGAQYPCHADPGRACLDGR
jgi:hypothetical protein